MPIEIEHTIANNTMYNCVYKYSESNTVDRPMDGITLIWFFWFFGELRAKANKC